jgi:hypothetical protein
VPSTSSASQGATSATPLATPSPAPSSAPSVYTQNIANTAGWIASSAQLSDGALTDSSTHISPYFGNRAAIGLAIAGGHNAAVRKWMAWYVAHLNSADVWGTSGTVYDYTVSAAGAETSTNTSDSTDSYAATFLSLALAFYRTNDASAQQYVLSLRPQLDSVANVIVNGQQPDGLTWARPDYHIKYLMDNTEVYAGLSDYATLLATGFNDQATSAAFTARAQRTASAIEAQLWSPSDNEYYNYVGEAGFKQPVDWTNYYSSAGELFPILYGLITPASSRAQSLYSRFNSTFSTWAQLEKPDKYPWALVSTVAALMNDATRANSYVSAVDSQYASRGYPYPWYDAEGGWFVETNALLSSSNSASKRRVIASFSHH